MTPNKPNETVARITSSEVSIRLENKFYCVCLLLFVLLQDLKFFFLSCFAFILLFFTLRYFTLLYIYFVLLLIKVTRSG